MQHAVLPLLALSFGLKVLWEVTFHWPRIVAEANRRAAPDSSGQQQDTMFRSIGEKPSRVLCTVCGAVLVVCGLGLLQEGSAAHRGQHPRNVATSARSRVPGPTRSEPASSCQDCPACRGSGEQACSICFGHGRRRCDTCRGSGRRINNSPWISQGDLPLSSSTVLCDVCGGSGEVDCFACNHGKVHCSLCGGRGDWP